MLPAWGEGCRYRPAAPARAAIITCPALLTRPPRASSRRPCRHCPPRLSNPLSRKRRKSRRTRTAWATPSWSYRRCGGRPSPPASSLPVVSEPWSRCTRSGRGGICSALCMRRAGQLSSPSAFHTSYWSATPCIVAFLFFFSSFVSSFWSLRPYSSCPLFSLNDMELGTGGGVFSTTGAGEGIRRRVPPWCHGLRGHPGAHERRLRFFFLPHGRKPPSWHCLRLV